MLFKKILLSIVFAASISCATSPSNISSDNGLKTIPKEKTYEREKSAFTTGAQHFLAILLADIVISLIYGL